jgi:ATP-binding cassette subfamily F protein 3
VDRIVNIEHAKARAYRGNYSAFEDQRAAELAEQSALFTRQQQQIRHMESFVERFRAQATKARQAQSRLKALERMQRIAPAHVDSPFEFEFRQPDKLPRPLLALENQSAGYADQLLLQQVNLTLAPGDRIALLGRNGAGKSTLMKLLAGELQAGSGSRTEARDLALGYFAQHQLEQLVIDDSALGNLKRLGGSLATRATEQELRDFLAGFGFAGERVFAPVAPFSGGEKARLMLAVVTFRRPNLLLLDEPTNHLDLEMRQALAVALQDYAGAVVVVSHDRHLLRTVADQFYVVHAGRVQPFDGDLEDYAQWLAAQAGAANAAESAAAAANTGAAAVLADSAEARRQRRREDAQRRAQLSPLKAQLARLEKQLDALARDTAEVQAALAAADIYTEGAKGRLRELLEKQTQLARETERVEAQWLAGGEEFEALQRSLAEATD